MQREDVDREFRQVLSNARNPHKHQNYQETGDKRNLVQCDQCNKWNEMIRLSGKSSQTRSGDLQ